MSLLLRTRPSSRSRAFRYTTVMELKPEIVRRLQKDRRRLFAFRAAIIATILVLIAAVLVFVICPWLAGSTHFSPLVKTTGMTAGTWIALGVLLLLGVVLVLIYVPARARMKSYFLTAVATTRDYDRPTLARFLNSLEGVAQDAGIKAARLEVLAGDVPNAFAFQGTEGPAIGITGGMLTADLEPAEIRAVLADETAAIIAGDYLRRPGSFRFEHLTYILLGLASVFSLLSLPVIRAGKGSSLTFLAALVELAGIIGIGWLIRRYTKATGHDAVRADSIAADITGDSGALERAIERADLLVNKRRRMPFPSSDYALEYMFARPHNWSETPQAWLERRSKELDYDLAGKKTDKRIAGIRQEMDALAQSAIESRDARLAALRAK